MSFFVDGANLFYAAQELEVEIDYTKLLRCLSAGSRLSRSCFYTGVERVNEKQQGFLMSMRHIGYRVTSKELAQSPHGSKKADLDIEITVDMMSWVTDYDTAVLVRDGDLAYAVNAVCYQGARVEVVSLRSMTSSTDRYTNLDTIKKEIQKPSCRRSFNRLAEAT